MPIPTPRPKIVVASNENVTLTIRGTQYLLKGEVLKDVEGVLVEERPWRGGVHKMSIKVRLALGATLHLPKLQYETQRKLLSYRAKHGEQEFVIKRDTLVQVPTNAVEVNQAQQRAVNKVRAAICAELIQAGKVAIDADVPDAYGFESLIRLWSNYFYSSAPGHATRPLYTGVLERFEKRITRELRAYAAERRKAMKAQHRQGDVTIDQRLIIANRLAIAGVNPFARTLVASWAERQPGGAAGNPLGVFLERHVAAFLAEYPEAKW